MKLMWTKVVLIAVDMVNRFNKRNMVTSDAYVAITVMQGYGPLIFENAIFISLVILT